MLATARKQLGEGRCVCGCLATRKLRRQTCCVRALLCQRPAGLADHGQGTRPRKQGTFVGRPLRSGVQEQAQPDLHTAHQELSRREETAPRGTAISLPETKTAIKCTMELMKIQATTSS